MSDIEMTVKYMVNKDGDCKECECSKGVVISGYLLRVCRAFNNSNHCKDFLKKEAEKNNTDVGVGGCWKIIVIIVPTVRF